MALNGYRHLMDGPIPVLVTFYTAFLIYLDDLPSINNVREFHERFMRGAEQKDPVLGHFCNLLAEFSQHFHDISFNIIISSTLSFVNAILLEDAIQGVDIQHGAVEYPTFHRKMSGASEFFAIALFPQTVPVTVYIQALPELMVFINNGNDILSFYKEECNQESVNRISMLAKCNNSSKSEVLAQLTNEAIRAHNTILEILEPSRIACEAYKAFSSGYIGFHLAYHRYRLNELNVTMFQ
ncbi:isoprenoid synthase domain-containing protein [Mycena floridula]|nr:isoprenoid synthase domain-containing protein [Mycena floridula]